MKEKRDEKQEEGIDMKEGREGEGGGGGGRGEGGLPFSCSHGGK